MNRYIHTLNGRPAYFGGQLWNATNGVSLDRLLVKDLKTIRRQQQLSVEWRKKQFPNSTRDHAYDVGYLRVKL